MLAHCNKLFRSSPSRLKLDNMERKNSTDEKQGKEQLLEKNC